jgi:hypothetical protein
MKLRCSNCWMVIACILISTPSLLAQPPNAAVPAPIPAQIITANKVFISNCGLDGSAYAAFKRVGEIDQAYNRFYAAMKGWARYELVASPADADLVFEIRFTAPTFEIFDQSRFEPQFNLAIVDAKTHFTLWTLLEPVEGAFRKATFERNMNQGLANLMSDLKRLATIPAVQQK